MISHQKMNFGDSEKCLYNDSYGSQYLLLMQWRHRKPWGFLLSYQNYLFWGERGHATLFPWQDWTQDPAQSGHTLDYHDNVRSLLFSSLYTVAYQKKKHSQHVLILSFYKQDNGWLSNSNNFYSQSICIWFKYLSLECNDKVHSHCLEVEARSGQRVVNNELVQLVGTESIV